MGTTTNYGYNVPVGSDNVNLLPQMAANFPMIDSDLKAVSDAAIGSATELTTGTVHALTRADTSRNVFVFVATSNFEAGETFEVDGVQVTAKTPDGQNLSTGAYVINSGVLCVLNGTLLTVIVNPTKALDADKLDGHDSSYFAVAEDLSALDASVTAISGKVGTGTLDIGNNCVQAINALNANVTEVNNQLTNDVASADLLQWAVQHYKSNSVVFAHYSGSADSKPSSSAGFIQVFGVTDSYVWIIAYSFDNHIYKRVKSGTWEASWTLIG